MQSNGQGQKVMTRASLADVYKGQEESERLEERMKIENI